MRLYITRRLIRLRIRWCMGRTCCMARPGTGLEILIWKPRWFLRTRRGIDSRFSGALQALTRFRLVRDVDVLGCAYLESEYLEELMFRSRLYVIIPKSPRARVYNITTWIVLDAHTRKQKLMRNAGTANPTKGVMAGGKLADLGLALPNPFIFPSPLTIRTP